VPFVFALLVVVALFVLLWKLRDAPSRPPRPGRGPAVRPRRPVRSVAPDDDPDFLRELGRRMRRDKPDG
jgi:hypothetical protein